MKKVLFVFVFCLFVIQSGYSQTETEQELSSRRDRTFNELSINAFNLIVFGSIDASYERVLSRQTSLSLDVFSLKPNKNEGEDGDLSQVFSKQFSLTTKFKYFISENKSAWGVYANAFAMYSDGIHENTFEFENERGDVFEKEGNIEYQDLALGIGIGNKYVSKGGFLLDISLGLGRNLFNKYSPNLVMLANVNLGYRF